jgi:hypothetical protein
LLIGVTGSDELTSIATWQRTDEVAVFARTPLGTWRPFGQLGTAYALPTNLESQM